MPTFSLNLSSAVSDRAFGGGGAVLLSGTELPLFNPVPEGSLVPFRVFVSFVPLRVSLGVTVLPFWRLLGGAGFQEKNGWLVRQIRTVPVLAATLA